MTAKEKVKKAFPKARSQRFQTHDGSWYSLVFADFTTMGARLGEGETTAKAWTDAWRHIKDAAK